MRCPPGKIEPLRQEVGRVEHAVHKVKSYEVVGRDIPTADPDHSVGEERFITFGLTVSGRLLTVAHTESGDTIRIISARPVTADERRIYEEGQEN